MNFVFFCHSLASCWNHGNAHFLRGVVRALQARGHAVTVYEPHDAWSLANLVKDEGPAAAEAWKAYYPTLASTRYRPGEPDLHVALAEADVVLVHEWNAPQLVQAVGEVRKSRGGFTLLFHDTHHRAVTRPKEMNAYDLSGYDAALVFGEVLRRIYLRRRYTPRAYTWHEAADVEHFSPRPDIRPEHDLVWVGNWGDDERTEELHAFLLAPCAELKLDATVHGVRYPPAARAALKAAGVRYGGWLPNHAVPEVFARHKVTVHVPRRPYREQLHGIPTIRPFEAMACGIPLVCSPWSDAEALFTPGRDYLVAPDGEAMTKLLRRLLEDEEARTRLAVHGRETILRRHTCGHRADELLNICDHVKEPPAALGVPTTIAI